MATLSILFEPEETPGAASGNLYRVTMPLVAIRLHSVRDSDQPGVLSTIWRDAILEVGEPSKIGSGMVEVIWRCETYVVFRVDLAIRATPIETCPLPH